MPLLLLVVLTGCARYQEHERQNITFVSIPTYKEVGTRNIRVSDKREGEQWNWIYRKFGGKVVAFNGKNRQFKSFIDSFPRSQFHSITVAEELDLPDVCVDFINLATPPLKAKIPLLFLPGNYKTWFGAGRGGCGILATAEGQHRLTGKKIKSLNEKEWNKLAIALKTDERGTTFPEKIQTHFSKAGFCSVVEKFAGDRRSYQNLKERLELSSCHSSFLWWNRHDRQYSHQEAIIKVLQEGQGLPWRAVTNSWGHYGSVMGGNSGNFVHIPAFKQKWPGNGAEVRLLSACPCEELRLYTRELLRLRPNR